MGKMIFLKGSNNTNMWIVSPDITVASFLKGKRKLTPLDIFFTFAQKLPMPKGKPKDFHAVVVKPTMLEIDAKLVQLGYFAHELVRSEKALLTRNRSSKRRVYSYKPFQVFQGLLDGYLDSFQGIRGTINFIDKTFGHTYAGTIWKQEWTRELLDLRNICRHVESPMVTIAPRTRPQRGWTIVLNLQRLSKIRTPSSKAYRKIIKRATKSATIAISAKRIQENAMLLRNELDKWALRYLKKIKPTRTADLITGFHSNGLTRSKKVTLAEFMALAQMPK